MPAYRKVLLSGKFTGDGFAPGDGGTGEIDIAAEAITSTEIADGAVAPEKLEGGAASPANNTRYGVDGSGNLGFHDAGSSSPATYNEVQLTVSGATLDLQYLGSTTITNSALVQSPTGTWTLTVPTGCKLISSAFVGTSAHLAGSGGSASWIWKIVDTDGRTTRFIPALLNGDDNDTYQDLQANGHNPSQDTTTTPGTNTSLWSAMGYTNFTILMTYINNSL